MPSTYRTPYGFQDLCWIIGGGVRTSAAHRALLRDRCLFQNLQTQNSHVPYLVARKSPMENRGWLWPQIDWVQIPDLLHKYKTCQTFSKNDFNRNSRVRPLLGAKPTCGHQELAPRVIRPSTPWQAHPNQQTQPVT